MKVSKYMTDKLVTVGPHEGSRHAFFKMREHGIRHLLVVEGDALLGIVSDRDLRRPDWVDESIDVSHLYQLDDGLEVKDLMTPNPVCVHTYDTLHRAVAHFLERKFGALPVLNKEEQLVGILSPLDCLKAFDKFEENVRHSVNCS